MRQLYQHVSPPPATSYRFRVKSGLRSLTGFTGQPELLLECIILITKVLVQDLVVEVALRIQQTWNPDSKQ